MRKDNNVNYNTPESDVKAFSDFVPEEEKKALKKLDRTSLNNEDDRYNLPNVSRMKYNKVTKTWQDLSKSQVKDKLKSVEKAVEKISIKTFEEVVLDNTVSEPKEYTMAFGPELNSETFFTSLEKSVYSYQSQLDQLKELTKSNPHTLSTLLEIDIALKEISTLISDRHNQFK